MRRQIFVLGRCAKVGWRIRALIAHGVVFDCRNARRRRGEVASQIVLHTC